MQFNKRALEKLRAHMQENNIPIFIIAKPANLFYILEKEASGFLVVTQNKTEFLTPKFFRYSEIPFKKIYNSKKELTTELKKLLNGKEVFTDAEKNKLKKIRGVFNKIKSSDFLENLRTVKSREEIERLRKACKITTKLMQEIEGSLNDHLTEWELYTQVNNRILKRKLQPSFDPLIQINSVEPHRKPTDKKITKKDLLIVDIGVKYKGYCSDMTRTFCQNPDNKKSKLYKDVLYLQKKAISDLNEGVSYEKIAKKVEKLLVKKGYNLSENYLHYLGHGVGIEIHEKISSGKNLQRGNVFTVEPGLYVPKIGGVRIEDTIIINEKGEKEILTKFPKKLF